MRPPPAPRAVPLSEIAAAVGGRQVGAETAIEGVSSLEEAGPGHLAYVDGDRLTEAALASRASALLVGPGIAGIARPQIVVSDPRFAFVRVVERFFTAPRIPRGIAAEMVRGADVEIGPDASIWPLVTLGDRVKLGAGTESGTVIRLRSKGIPNLGRRGRGDLHLTIHVETPRDLGKEQRRLLEELAEMRGEAAGGGPAVRAHLRRPTSPV